MPRSAVRPETCNFIKKETLAQVFYCEFCEISKNTFFQRTPLVDASKISLQVSFMGAPTHTNVVEF